jgi:hypothetical protein
MRGSFVPVGTEHSLSRQISERIKEKRDDVEEKGRLCLAASRQRWEQGGTMRGSICVDVQ